MNAPPLLVSFSSLTDLFQALPESVTGEQRVAIAKLFDRGLPPAVSVRAVATIFGVGADFIGAIVKSPRRHYRTFKIRKGKKTREIQAPRVVLKTLQRWLACHIAASVEFPEYVVGFVAGKSVVNAAQIHCPATWVYSVDIRDFFPSISAAQVNLAFRQLGYDEHAAQMLTDLCTLEGRLPQGSPASPVLSNLVFAMTDVRLHEIAQLLKVRYSRYADDLVFSGNGDPPPRLGKGVLEALSRRGWKVAPEKVHLAKLPARLKVHGLLVQGAAPRLTKGYRNKLRAFRHLLKTRKDLSPKDMEKMKGHLAYARMVDTRSQEESVQTESDNG